MAGGKQCAKRSTITPSKTCSAYIYRCIKRRVGRSLRRTPCKGNLVPTGKQVAHKPLGAESSISSSKGVSNPGLQQDSVDSYRQHNSGCLYQQRGGVEIGLPVCPTVENTVLVYQATSNTQGTSHPRPAERDSRQAIQAWPDHSNRVVTSSRSVPSCMLKVALATSGPVCHQVQQQTATFYCVNTPYLVDRCICPAPCRSRQTLEKNVLSWALVGTGSVLFTRQVAVQPACRCTAHARTCAVPLFVWRERRQSYFDKVFVFGYYHLEQWFCATNFV